MKPLTLEEIEELERIASPVTQPISWDECTRREHLLWQSVAQLLAMARMAIEAREIIDRLTNDKKGEQLVSDYMDAINDGQGWLSKFEGAGK